MKDKIKSLYRLNEQELKTLNMAYKKPQIYMNSVAAIALCQNGSIMVIHNPMNYDFSGWESVIKVSCGKNHLVGLRSDGTVLAVGDNSDGQCDVSAWRDVADIAAYDDMTAGLSTAGESFIAGRTFPTGTAAVCAVETADKKMQDTDIQETVSGTIRDSWDEIIANINNGTYADKYKIGDTKALDLGSEGVVEMQIVAFDADELAEGGGKAAITWISKQLLKTPCHMNRDTGASHQGGWGISEMRIYLKMKIRPLIPKNVRNAIKSVKKYSLYKNETGRFPSVEDVWIPSYREIFGGSSFERSGAEYSAFFCDYASRIKCNADGSAVWWWLRSASTRNGFYSVYTDGSYSNYNASNTGGVALGFCT